MTGEAGAWFAGNGQDLNYWISAFGDSQVTGAHFHCAAPGQDGPIVVSLMNKSASSTSGTNGEIGRGYLTNSDIAATGAQCASTIGFPIKTVADLALAMLEGMIYANVHTSDNPNGAARGQLTLPNHGWWNSK